jgi:hypothetical protein
MFERILKTLALSLVLGAVFAGSAAASVMIQASDFGTAQSSKAIVSEKTAGLYPVTQPLVSEKLGGVLPQTQSETTLVSEKVAGLDLRPTEVTPVATTGGGFDWNDAGIGAGITFASLLAATAGVFALHRHRGPGHRSQVAH